MSRSIIIDHKANIKPRIFVKEVLPFPLLQSGRRSKSPYYEEPVSEREEWWRSTLKVTCDLYSSKLNCFTIKSPESHLSGS